MICTAAAASDCVSPSNIVLGKTVTISVEGNDGKLAYEGESASDITDGSLTYISPEQRKEDGCVGWCNSTSGQQMTVTLTIDLGARYEISCIRYNTGDTDHADTWAADSMTTALGTTSIEPGSEGSGAWTNQYGNTTTSSLTITLTKTNSGTDQDWLFIGEIQVWGVPAGLPDSVLLDVTFASQFCSTSFVISSNVCCGPTSLSMCGCYANGLTDVCDHITAINTYLGRSTDCSGTGGVGWDLLLQAGAGVFGLSGLTHEIWDISQIKAELAEGGPMIVGVKAGCLSNRGYTYTGGHYIVAIGYDADDIICNDPGTSFNQPKYYSNSDFTEAITATGSGIPNGVIHGFRKE